MEPAAIYPPVPGGGRDDDDALRPPAPPFPPPQQRRQQQRPSRYESQKRRDWKTFLQFLSNHYEPGLHLALCAGAHVVEFLEYLDQFGKTKVHAAGCTHFGLLRPPGPCGCPTRQAWGSLDALIGRLRSAYYAATAAGGPNPFGSPAVKAHLREVRESQAKARGVAYDKKKGKRHHQMLPPPSVEGSSSAATVAAATSTSVTVAVAGSSISTATNQGVAVQGLIRDPGHADEAGNLTTRFMNTG